MHTICYWLLVFCDPAGNCYFLHITLQTKKAKPKLTFLYCTGNYSSQQLYLNKLYLKMGTRTWCLAFFFVSPTSHKNKNWEPFPNFYWYFVLHFLAIGQHSKVSLVSWGDMELKMALSPHTNPTWLLLRNALWVKVTPAAHFRHQFLSPLQHPNDR